jgi:type IV pilus assembly protein PilV
MTDRSDNRTVGAYKHQGGFTLVESLVALIVLSVGMLGIAALYVESLSAGRIALQRTEAVTLASDMADRIRANRDGGLGYAGGGGVVCNPALAGASSFDTAANDASCWIADVAATLPAGLGSIAVDEATTPRNYTITVSWTESGQAAASPATYVLVLQT